MSQEVRTRTFKSGNSIALRLPKSLGFAEGDEVCFVAHADGRFTLFRADRAREAFFSLPGRLSADFMKDGRGDTAQSERDWGEDGSMAAA